MNCNCCNRMIRANRYVLTGSNLDIYTGFTDTHVKNGKCYKLITCASLPSITLIVPVLVEFNGSFIPLLDCLGNSVMSDQIRSRRCYHVEYGNNNPHLILRQPICESAFESGSTAPAAMDAQSEDKECEPEKHPAGFGPGSLVPARKR